MRRFFFFAFLSVVYILFSTNLLNFIGVFNNSLSLRSEIVASSFSPPLGSKTLEVLNEDAAQKKRVHIGGQQVGFLLDVEGVIIEDFHEVDTIAGLSTIKSDLKVGDVIYKIDDVEVDSAQDVLKAINSANGVNTFKIRRNNQEIDVIVNPLVDRVSGEYRLGMGVKENFGGIGTVSFIKQDGRFGALGHCVGIDGYSIKIEDGNLYDCKILGLQKGTKGNAGCIKGTIERANLIGVVDKNVDYGIFGKTECCGELYDVAKREEVNCGKAQICSAISGEKTLYDVEIVKTMHQPSDAQKGIIIKVTDKRLLSLSGGIIQGMSGSPILQNGKIVGAVTHVFINDPTRGYGVYIDWMLTQ